jgi:hypothetical protein
MVSIVVVSAVMTWFQKLQVTSHKSRVAGGSCGQKLGQKACAMEGLIDFTVL